MPSKNGHTPNTAPPAPPISTEMLQPTVVFVALDLIDPNPWQPRQGEDTDHIQKLTDSIAVDGLLQIPTARRVAVVMSSDRFQLAFGHSRLAAYKRLHAQNPDDPRWREFPLNLRQLTDRQMADAAARENVTRKDLSAIEIAGAIQRYITDFGATQLEAGKVYGYNAQSSVSNLLRLLQLPHEVQMMVNNGEIAERHARELVPLSRLPENAVIKAAQEIVHDLKEDRYESPDSIVENIVEELAGQHGVTIGNDVWDMAWPSKPIDAAGEADGDTGEPTIVPACKGCQYRYERQYVTSVCLKPACYQLKMRIWRQHELDKLSKKLGIQKAKPEEKKLGVVFNGDYTNIDFAKQAIASKHESLRLMPAMDKRGSGYAHWVKDVMGSPVVWLATTDMDALKKAVLKERAIQRGAGGELDDYQARVRNENDERNKLRKACDKLVASAALDFEPLFTPEIVALTERAILSYDLSKVKPDDRAAELAKRCISSACEVDHWNPDVERTRNKIIALAKSLNVKLPDGWEHDAIAVPVNGKAKRGQK